MCKCATHQFTLIHWSVCRANHILPSRPNIPRARRGSKQPPQTCTGFARSFYMLMAQGPCSSPARTHATHIPPTCYVAIILRTVLSSVPCLALSPGRLQALMFRAGKPCSIYATCVLPGLRCSRRKLQMCLLLWMINSDVAPSVMPVSRHRSHPDPCKRQVTKENLAERELYQPTHKQDTHKHTRKHKQCTMLQQSHDRVWQG